jgi:hypothetical protein
MFFDPTKEVPDLELCKKLKVKVYRCLRGNQWKMDG